LCCVGVCVFLFLLRPCNTCVFWFIWTHLVEARKVS
jgi:hypothetical protein